MRELSKSIPRRIHDPYFMSKYFVGNGVDIGGFPDPLQLYVNDFPLISSVQVWDWDQGDAQFMKGVSDDHYDFVHSSHCLEHLADPFEGLRNWFRVLRSGGHLIVVVPEEDLYEQGVFPSNLNKDHKWTFSINKTQSWSQKSLSVLDLISDLGSSAELVRIQKLNIFNRENWPRYDQTRMPNTESGIEFVIQKRDLDALNNRTKQKAKNGIGPNFPKEIVPYLNQYKNDQDTLRANNDKTKPFASFDDPTDS